MTGRVGQVAAAGTRRTPRPHSGPFPQSSRVGRRLRGQLAGVLGLPRQLQKRRVIQPRRQIEDEELARMLVTK